MSLRRWNRPIKSRAQKGKPGTMNRRIDSGDGFDHSLPAPVVARDPGDVHRVSYVRPAFVLRDGGSRAAADLSEEIKMETLGSDLPKQMARVRDVLIPQYMEIGPAGGFAIAMMRRSLDRAATALAEGDLPAMIAAYKELKDYQE